MSPAQRTLKLPDGRQLAYAEFGAPQGLPTIYCHGFPGSRLEAGLFQNAALKKNLRVIAPDRNGLGESDPYPDRRLRDWASDMEALVDSLDIEAFFLIGISGGGPYALACAHHFGARVKRFSLVCPLGPLEEPALLQAMLWPARINFQSIRSMPLVWRFAYRYSIVPLAQLWPQWIYQMMLTMAPAPDLSVLKRSEVRAIITASLSEAIRQGANGVLQEMRLYTEPWGFSLSEIDTPIELWHGKADETVPILHGETLAGRLPNCNSHYVENHGHFSLPINLADQILKELIA
jgi:pimeloyl-ACP methyl ester carboxylesterase